MKKLALSNDQRTDSNLLYCIKRFLRFCETERDLSKSTIISYEKILGRFAEYSNQKKIAFIEQVTRDFIREFLAVLFKEKQSRNRLSRYISALRTFGRFLEREQIVPQANAFVMLDSPKLPRRIPEALSMDEVDKIITYPLRQLARDWAILETLYSTGCRASEICDLRNRDLDLQNGTAKVIGKGRKERIVFINSRAKRAIFLYAQTKGVEENHPQAYLFLSISNAIEPEGIDRTDLCNVVKKYARIIGIKKRVYPHIFRHSFATHLLENGAGIMEIKEMLGHSCVSTTQIYTHVSSKKLAQDHALLFDNKGASVSNRIMKQQEEIARDYDSLRNCLDKSEDNQFITEKDMDILIRRAENLKKQIMRLKDEGVGKTPEIKTAADIVKEAEQRCQENPYLTFKAAAKFMGVSLSTLIKWVREGRLRNIDSTGFGRSVSKKELEECLKEKPTWFLQALEHKDKCKRGKPCLLEGDGYVSIKEVREAIRGGHYKIQKYIKDGVLRVKPNIGKRGVLVEKASVNRVVTGLINRVKS